MESGVSANGHIEANDPINEPHPGIKRQSTVRFEGPGGESNLPTLQSSSNPPVSQPFHFSRTGTEETEASRVSRVSSKIELPWRQQTILAFDGGGIRGYSSLLILKEVMNFVEEIEKNRDKDAISSFHPEQYVPPHNDRKTSMPISGKRNGKQHVTNGEGEQTCRYFPCHYFDYIGGTSTGGLIAIMLGRLRMGIDQCLEEYEIFGGEIFGHPRWFSLRGPLPSFKEKYNSRRLQKAVEDVVEKRSPTAQKAVGAGSFGSAKELCKTVVVAYCWTEGSLASRYGDEAVDRVAIAGSTRTGPSSQGPYLFRSYDHWATPNERGERNIYERNPGPADNIPIWQVARATTAAPTYFDPINIQGNTFGDGGFGSNNPIKEIMLEVATMHGNTASVIDLMVSIGTGQADPVKLYPTGFNKLLSYMKATKALATESEQQHADMEGRTKIGSDLESLHYHRFNLPRDIGLKDMKLDQWKVAGKRRFTKQGLKPRDKGTLDKIRDRTQEYCQDPYVQENLRNVAQKLVEHRQSRCDGRRWEMWATGIRYRCVVNGCDKAQKLRLSKLDLKLHIEKMHPNQFGERMTIEDMIRRGTCPY